MEQSIEETLDLAERAKRVFTPNYRQAPVLFVRGEGVFLYDNQDKRYLDFAGGIAVSSLGHNHPKLVSAIADQAGKVMQTSNLFLNEPALELAERLTQMSFADRVFFCNSGTEANEAAIKLARSYMKTVRKENRYKIVCAQNGFHGRTLGSLSATGQEKYRADFEPLLPGFVYVPYNDANAVEEAIDDETCAVMMEPIQGEGGLIVPDDDYLKKLRAICDAKHVLLILDEVQTGVGRTGTFFAYEQFDVTPDIVTIAKGLAGGVPIGAMLCTREVSEGFTPGSHGSTFGGNPLACRAACTVLDVIKEENLLQNVRETGEQLQHHLQGLTKMRGVAGVRGRGLLQGLVVTPQINRAQVRIEALLRGLTITQAGEDTLRLLPPLIVTPGQIDWGVAILRSSIIAAMSRFVGNN